MTKLLIITGLTLGLAAFPAFAQRRGGGMRGAGTGGGAGIQTQTRTWQRNRVHTQQQDCTRSGQRAGIGQQNRGRQGRKNGGAAGTLEDYDRTRQRDRDRAMDPDQDRSRQQDRDRAMDPDRNRSRDRDRDNRPEGAPADPAPQP